MKVVLLLTILSILMGITPQTEVDNSPPEQLIFKGRVIRIGPNQGDVSGNIAVFQLAKYKVERICKGKYEAKEIVVDHLILTGKELTGVKVGDQVCLSVSKNEKIPNRYNAKGIRAPADIVNVFYIGRAINSSTDCICK